MTQGGFVAGVINEDAAHRFGGGGEKVGAAIPPHVFLASEPQPCFMDQHCGLQSLIRRFVGHPVSAELAQFLIDQRQQFIGGTGIAVFDGVENVGDAAMPRRWCARRRPK